MGLREKIQAIAAQLEDEMAIPAIKAEAPLIHTVASDEWWDGVTEPLLTEARSQGLGLFVRSLVGLDREAAMLAFGDLLQGGKATPEQIEFLELISNELTQNGVMPPERLFESPFTDVHAQGPLGVFPPTQVTHIVSALAQIRLRAVA